MNRKNRLKKINVNGTIRAYAMRSTLVNKIIVATVCSLLLCTAVNAESFPVEPVLLPLIDGSTIVISLSNDHIVARFRGERHTHPIRISKELSSHLLRSDEAHHLFKMTSEGRELFVLLSREPSNPLRRTGYCGAGYEDYLLRIEVEKKNIVLADEFLLQSCIKTISLYREEGGDPLEDADMDGISINKEKAFISFEWLKDPEKRRTISVEKGRFVMKVKEVAN